MIPDATVFGAVKYEEETAPVLGVELVVDLNSASCAVAVVVEHGSLTVLGMPWNSKKRFTGDCNRMDELCESPT